MSFPPSALESAEASRAFLEQSRISRPHPTSSERLARVVTGEVKTGVRFRGYVPVGEGPFPVLIYLHGGGWVSGDLEMHDETCRRIAARAGFVVFNVDYRLAPEHRFPAPMDDAYDATVWAAAHAGEYRGDPRRLTIAGSSAGGNLAAAVALRARDSRAVVLERQLLIYPVLDSRMSSESYRTNASGYHLSAPQMEWYWRQYESLPADRVHPLASPAHAKSLEGLPPAIVVTAEFDPLRDEGEEYAARLQAEAAGACLIRYPGQIHGFMGMLGVFADADAALDLVIARLIDEVVEISG